MSGRKVLPLIMAGTIAGAGIPIACGAAESITPRPQQVFVEKPRIDDYTDYNAFLSDVMEYRRQQVERARQETGIAPSAPAEAGSLYRITGEESLEGALERARRLEHPDYAEGVRFERTTSRSFPLDAMDPPDLSGSELTGMFIDPESGTAFVYEDDTTDRKIRKATDAATTDEEKKGREKATAEAYRLLGPGVAELLGQAVWVYDEDGQLFRLQLGDITNRYSFSYGNGDYTINRLSVDMTVQQLDK